jgi:hypothetical protein
MKALTIKEVEKTDDMTKNAPRDTLAVAFTRRPKTTHILTAMKNIPKLRAVFICESYMKVIGEAARDILKMNNIELKKTPDWLGKKRVDKTEQIIEIEE